MIKSISKFISSNWIQNVHGCRQISTQTFPLQFKASPALWAEPLKKKKKIDPNVLKAREERRKKRIMREIRKLQKLKKQLKPISDFEVPKCLKEDYENRKRIISISDEVAEERILLLKEWTRYKMKESLSYIRVIQKLVASQREALDELKLESKELYDAAVKIDENLFPFKFTGPVETPPKDDYPTPDGAYIDESKKWTNN